jgi:biotin operon repressor
MSAAAKKSEAGHSAAKLKSCDFISAIADADGLIAELEHRKTRFDSLVYYIERYRDASTVGGRIRWWREIVSCAPDLVSAARLVGPRIAARVGNDTGVAFPSQALLAEELDQSENTIRKGMRSLRSAGLLAYAEQTGRGNHLVSEPILSENFVHRVQEERAQNLRRLDEARAPANGAKSSDKLRKSRSEKGAKFEGKLKGSELEGITTPPPQRRGVENNNCSGVPGASAPGAGGAGTDDWSDAILFDDSVLEDALEYEDEIELVEVTRLLEQGLPKSPNGAIAELRLYPSCCELDRAINRASSPDLQEALRRLDLRAREIANLFEDDAFRTAMHEAGWRDYWEHVA